MCAGHHFAPCGPRHGSAKNLPLGNAGYADISGHNLGELFRQVFSPCELRIAESYAPTMVLMTPFSNCNEARSTPHCLAATVPAESRGPQLRLSYRGHSGGRRAAARCSPIVGSQSQYPP